MIYTILRYLGHNCSKDDLLSLGLPPEKAENPLDCEDIIYDHGEFWQVLFFQSTEDWQTEEFYLGGTSIRDFLGVEDYPVRRHSYERLYSLEDPEFIPYPGQVHSVSGNFVWVPGSYEYPQDGETVFEADFYCIEYDEEKALQELNRLKLEYNAIHWCGWKGCSWEVGRSGFAILNRLCNLHAEIEHEHRKRLAADPLYKERNEVLSAIAFRAGSSFYRDRPAVKQFIDTLTLASALKEVERRILTFPGTDPDELEIEVLKPFLKGE